MPSLFTPDPDDDMCIISREELKNVYMSGVDDGISNDFFREDQEFRFKVLPRAKRFKSCKMSLGPRQRECLRTIRRLYDEAGIMPTKQELGDAMGITRERARKIVNILAEKGYLIMIPYDRHGIVFTELGEEALVEEENEPEAEEGD